jgi:hypothetical protein
MTKEIPLTKGKVALVDDEDFEELSKHKWFYCAIGYAVRNKSKKIPGLVRCIYMHREIMNCPQEMIIDHVDHDTLNNQKSNLRICTYSQNLVNRLKYIRSEKSSNYKGVDYCNKSGNKWRVRVWNKHIGYYETELEAALVYDKIAKEIYGEFAYLNFQLEALK